MEVTLAGTKGGLATVVEVDVHLDEPGFSPPAVRALSPDGRLSLGPLAVAIVTDVAAV